jgi:hypothetical protein
VVVGGRQTQFESIARTECRDFATAQLCAGGHVHDRSAGPLQHWRDGHGAEDDHGAVADGSFSVRPASSRSRGAFVVLPNSARRGLAWRFPAAPELGSLPDSALEFAKPFDGPAPAGFVRPRRAAGCVGPSARLPHASSEIREEHEDHDRNPASHTKILTLLTLSVKTFRRTLQPQKIARASRITEQASRITEQAC